MLVLQSHYRSATNFSWDSLEAARNRRRHWMAVANYATKFRTTLAMDRSDKVKELIEQAIAAMENDLDTPNALKYFDQAFDMFKPEQTDLGTLEHLIDSVDQLLGMNLAASTPDISAEDYTLIDQRQQTRQKKDWSAADALRDQLAERGITIKDGASPIWTRS